MKVWVIWNQRNPKKGDRHVTSYQIIQFEGEKLQNQNGVVLDKGAKFSNGLSLNDTLQVGPTIQQDFYSVVLLFKTHQVWFTTDIAKIYRHIMLLPQNRNIEKFLGYILLKTPTRSTDSPVNYGTSSAPFLETRCLKKLADDNQDQYPKAA